MTLRDQLQAAGPGVAAVSDQELGELDEMVNGEQLGKIMIEIPRTPKSSTKATPSVRLKTPLPLAPVTNQKERKKPRLFSLTTPLLSYH